MTRTAEPGLELERGGYRYAGGKGGAGVLHRIIGAMPRHRVYVEAFLGGGAVLAAKRPAEWEVGIDPDPRVIQRWRQPARRPGLILVEGDAMRILSHFSAMMDPSWLIYCDPPYLRSVRTRLQYRHEFATDFEHRRLLSLLLTLKASVMISGYLSALYGKVLRNWRSFDFTAMTRGGVRIERVWCNFAEPEVYHDPVFCGSGFRERERVKRRRQRWVARLGRMKPYERQIIREALADVDGRDSAIDPRHSWR